MNYIVAIAPADPTGILLANVPDGTVGVISVGPENCCWHRVIMLKGALYSLDNPHREALLRRDDYKLYVRPLAPGETITLTGK